MKSSKTIVRVYSQRSILNNSFIIFLLIFTGKIICNNCVTFNDVRSLISCSSYDMQKHLMKKPRKTQHLYNEQNLSPIERKFCDFPYLINFIRFLHHEDMELISVGELSSFTPPFYLGGGG